MERRGREEDKGEGKGRKVRGEGREKGRGRKESRWQ